MKKLRKLKVGMLVASTRPLRECGDRYCIGTVFSITSNFIMIDDVSSGESICRRLPIVYTRVLKKLSTKKFARRLCDSLVDNQPIGVDLGELTVIEDEIPKLQSTLADSFQKYTDRNIGVSMDSDRLGDGSGGWIEIKKDDITFVISFDGDGKEVDGMAVFKDTVESVSTDVVYKM